MEIVLMLAGLVVILKPEFFWELKLLDRILRNMDKDGDPSPDELLPIRMGGMLILLVAFVLFLQKIF